MGDTSQENGQARLGSAPSGGAASRGARAIYNEIDPFAAAWMRELIARGHIAPGVVDERSIKDLTPDDVRGSGQRHFFAGIGGWSYALRLAGVPDDLSVWTGSCPCQPFSQAGRRKGIADDRHLWPDWFRLIRECRPAVVFGEQVASKDGVAWLHAVRADLESAGYAVGAADLPAAGVGAPHKRQRLFFVAYANGVTRGLQLSRGESRRTHAEAFRRGEARSLANRDDSRLEEQRKQPAREELEATQRSGEASFVGNTERDRSGSRRIGESHRRSTIEPNRSGSAGSVGNAGGERSWRNTGAVPRAQDEGRSEWEHARRLVDLAGAPSPTRGFWADAEWLACRDGKARAVSPGTFPLASGVPGRVGRIRGSGNAIVPQVAATFIEAALDAIGLRAEAA